jgi:hypothetical protein
VRALNTIRPEIVVSKMIWKKFQIKIMENLKFQKSKAPVQSTSSPVARYRNVASQWHSDAMAGATVPMARTK